MAKPRTTVTRKWVPVSKQEVKQIIRGNIQAAQEIKRYVTSVSGTTAAAGLVVPITQGIVQGDTISTRDGNQCVVKHLKVFRVMTYAGAAEIQRAIVFWDSMAQGALPAVADVLASAAYYDGYNVITSQQRRFHILADTFLTTTNVGANAINCETLEFKLNHRVTFDATTNVAAANGRGAMYVLYISAGVLATYVARYEVAFTDS